MKHECHGKCEVLNAVESARTKILVEYVAK